jgi:hypothetical protein
VVKRTLKFKSVLSAFDPQNVLNQWTVKRDQELIEFC